MNNDTFYEGLIKILIVLISVTIVFTLFQSFSCLVSRQSLLIGTIFFIPLQILATVEVTLGKLEPRSLGRCWLLLHAF